MDIILSNLNRFTKFIAVRFRGKFAVNWLLKIQPLLTYIATLPCENINVRKQAIIDKLQGSVATYLRFGRVVNMRIKKGLLLSLSVKKMKSVFGKVTSKNVVVSCTLRTWPTHC